MLGDIGGLFDALLLVSFRFLSGFFFFFGNPMHKFLLKTLFLKNPKENTDEKEVKSMSDENKF